MKRLLVCIAVGAVIALTISVLAFSLTAMFRPDWLYKADPIVCPEGTTLDLRNASPVPGELVLEAKCAGEGIEQDVTARLLLTAMGAVFVPALLLGTLVMWLKG